MFFTNNNIYKIKKRKIGLFRLYELCLIVFLFLYLISLIFLTLQEVKISSNKIIFLLPENKFFYFSIYNKFSAYNMLINIVLFYPFGILLKSFNAIYYKTLNPIVFPLFFSILIEFLQIVLPVYRVFDVFDIVFNTLSAFFSYNIIKTPKSAFLIK